MRAGGWWYWRRCSAGRRTRPIARIGLTEAAIVAATTVAASYGMLLYLRSLGDSAPLADAVTTALSLVATWTQARTHLEHWLIWIAAHAIYVPVYAFKARSLTAVVYGVFALMCVKGWRDWRRTPAATESRPRTQGAVIGRFMPLDTGHEHLIRTALDRARSVTVIVVARRDHAILGAERARWIEEAFPDETVVVLDQDEVGLADDDTAGSARETIRAIGRAPDVALTSERYGGAWAAAMAQGVHPTSRRDRHALRRGGDARTADAAGDGRGRRTARRGTGAGRVGERTMNSVQTPGVDMVFVLSTAIEAIGYDQRRRELYVRFRETGTYVYSDVPEAAYAGFLQADSNGSYANDLVKPYYSWHEL